MTIKYTFLQAKYPCVRAHHSTIQVFLQEDLSLDINNNFQVQLPLSFMIHGGAVVLNTIDDRLVPVKQIYMTGSPKEGLIVTLYNRSYQRVSINKGYLFIIVRYIE